MNAFTKTETLRRLRVARKLILSQDSNLHRNGRTEVGTRMDPNTYQTLEAALAATDNDLNDSMSIVDAAGYSEVREHGYIVNMYFYDGGWDGYLNDVQNVWLGTPDQEPVLLHRTLGPITTGVLA